MFRGKNVTQNAGDLVKEARMPGGRRTRRLRRKSRRRYR